MNVLRVQATRRTVLGLAAASATFAPLAPPIAGSSTPMQDTNQARVQTLHHIPLSWYSSDFSAAYTADLPFSFSLLWPAEWSRWGNIKVDVDPVLCELAATYFIRGRHGRHRGDLIPAGLGSFEGQFQVLGKGSQEFTLRLHAAARNLFPQENLGLRAPFRLRIADLKDTTREIVVEAQPREQPVTSVWGTELYPFFASIAIETPRGQRREYRYPTGAVMKSIGPGTAPASSIDFSVDSGYVDGLAVNRTLLNGAPTINPVLLLDSSNGAHVFSAPVPALASGETFRLDLVATPRASRRPVRNLVQSSVIVRESVSSRTTGRISGADLTASGNATVPEGAEGTI